MKWEPTSGTSNYSPCVYCGSATQNHVFIHVPELRILRPMYFCNGKCLNKLSSILKEVDELEKDSHEK
jgi:hypothetical protein